MAEPPDTAAVPAPSTGRVDAPRPLLLVDVDGVLALFNIAAPVGVTAGDLPAGTWHMIEGFPYYLASGVAELLHELATHFDLVWCTGWEDRANDHLPRLLGVPGPLPVIRFARNPGRKNAHWKLDEITAYAGDRPVAWIDDALDERCHAWAQARHASGLPTLLVQTEPHLGMNRPHLEQLTAWAAAL